MIRTFIRGISNGDIREKVYDADPATLQDAIDRAQALARAHKLRRERNGPYVEQAPAERREEPMEIGYLGEGYHMKAAAAVPSTSASAKEDMEELKRQIKGIQTQLKKLHKDRKEGGAGKQPSRGYTGNVQRTGGDRRRWDDSGKPYCLGCNGLGHIKRNCPNQQVATTGSGN